jgi:RNA polymerase sigma factor for flagellar operon FliA
MKEDVSDLWVAYKENDSVEARNGLILHYIYIVKYLANRLAINLSSLVQTDELSSYGIEGLIDAIQRFDHRRNIKFETYAIARIRGAMIDGMRKIDQVPVSLRQKSKELEKIYASLEVSLGRSATDPEVAEAMGLSLQAFHSLLGKLASTAILSLDDFVGGEDSGNKKRVVDLLEDNRSISAEELIEIEENRRILAESISRLPEKEKMVIYLYYYEGLTLKEIGEVLHLSESRISQLHAKSILRLRGSMKKQMLTY